MASKNLQQMSEEEAQWADQGNTENTEELIETAELYQKNGNQEDVRYYVQEAVTQLELGLNGLIQTCQGQKVKDMPASKSLSNYKDLAENFKKCFLILIKEDDLYLKAIQCFYKALICSGNPVFVEDDVMPLVWNRFLSKFDENFQLSFEMLNIISEACNELYRFQPFTRIVLFVAFEVMRNILRIISQRKAEIGHYIHRFLVICAKCHYLLKEYKPSVEALEKLCGSYRSCPVFDILEMWAWCLYHLDQCDKAIQIKEHCMALELTDQQKKNMQQLEIDVKQKLSQIELQLNQGARPKVNNATQSVYEYGDVLNLLEFNEIEQDKAEDWSDTESIAETEYSSTTEANIETMSLSSFPTRTKRRKLRRKTKAVHKKKGIDDRNYHSSSESICSADHVDIRIKKESPSDKFDRIKTWSQQTSQFNSRNKRPKSSFHGRQGLSIERINSELLYSRQKSDKMSDTSSVTSRTATSLVNLSADEFSGSDYDDVNSDEEWYIDEIEEEVNEKIDEVRRDETTYYDKSVRNHSGNFKAGTILEEEYFQKGLKLSEECIESLGSHYFKGKTLHYENIIGKDFNLQCRNLPTIYKKCTINIESAHFAICKPIEPTDEIQEIEICGRSKCGMTYTDDTVVVEIYPKHRERKTCGKVVSRLERHRYKEVDHPVLVCLIDLKEGHLMKPMCRTVPKLHILHSKVERNHKRMKRSRVEIYKYDEKNESLRFIRYYDVQEEEREHVLFVVAIIKWKPNKIYPLAAVIDVIHCSQNPYDGIRIISKEHHVPYLYEKETVEGVEKTRTDAKQFDASQHKNKQDLQVFTIDPPNAKDLDDALSVETFNEGYQVGVHISDVSSFVAKGDPVDIEAEERCITFYPGKGFRPYAMIPEPLSEGVCSLKPNTPRPVISVYFRFDKKGRYITDFCHIEKSVIKSKRQFTYQDAQDIIDGKEVEFPTELIRPIQLLYWFSVNLKTRRLNDAAFAMPVEIDIGEEENPMDTYQAHSLVEEFMILANSLVATRLRQNFPTCIPLICQFPPADKVFQSWYNLNKHYIYQTLGLQFQCSPVGNISVHKPPAEERKSHNRLRMTPVQKWIFDELIELVTNKDIEGTELRIKQLICTDYFHPKQALAYQDWVTFQESSKYVCSKEFIGQGKKAAHFSLRKTLYVHFTSPIRRYCDIIIHRLVTAMLTGSQCPYEAHEVETLCHKMNDATRRANQFKKDCMEFLLGRFLKNQPVLLNGFVRELSDKGVKFIIPGLQKFAQKRKEITFNSLDVGSKPEIWDDVDMLEMTSHEKERKMVAVKWEKRLYSFKHRVCKKPKPSRFQQDKMIFSPFLRIFPHQNTVFLRYKEHWTKILSLLIKGEGSLYAVRRFIGNFKGYDEFVKPESPSKEEKQKEKEGENQTEESVPVQVGTEVVIVDNVKQEDQKKAGVEMNNVSKDQTQSNERENIENVELVNSCSGGQASQDAKASKSKDSVIAEAKIEDTSGTVQTQTKEIKSETENHVQNKTMQSYGEQMRFNIIFDRKNLGSFNRSVMDASSEVRQGIIVEHRCKFRVPFHHGQIIQVQMSGEIKRGFLTPTPQLLNITDNIKFCMEHFNNPVKTLLRYAKLSSKNHYKSVEEYIEIWIPIIEMESTVDAASSEDTAVINDMPIEFKGRRGRFILTRGFCDIRDLDIHAADDERRSHRDFLGMEKNNRDDVDTGNGKNNSELNQNVEEDGNDSESNLSLDEEVLYDRKQKESFDISTLLVNETNPENDYNQSNNNNEQDNTSQHSSVKRKPKYTEVLSPHFLCIKMKRPLPECVKKKVGHCLPKDCSYIWIGHGSILKTRSIKTKKFSERRGTEKKVLEIDIVFQLHENSPPPPVGNVTSDDKCSVELILKSKVFRRIEHHIKMLPEASDLAKAIALKELIQPLDSDYVKLCEEMTHEIDSPEFPHNNKQQGIAIHKALTSGFSLIQGPPGTGKTFTGVKLVYLFNQLNRMLETKDGMKRKLIFCGPSNKSVDLVARWMVNKLKDKAPKFIRIYASSYEYQDFPVPGRVAIASRSMRDSKTDAELREKGVVLHYVIRNDGKPLADNLKEYDDKFHEDNEIIKENEKLPHEKRLPVKTKLEDIYGYKRVLHEATVTELEQYDVILCTTSMAANPRLLQVTKGHVAQVIIDECGMCSEPESMVPIIATHAKQIVLIGDHKQLQPIIMCREAAQHGLQKSLFERYSTEDKLMTMLQEQYRMHPSICQFPSEQFYEGKLKTAKGIGKSHQPLTMWPRDVKEGHIPRVFCHVEGEEETLTVKTKEGNEQSRSNRKEIEQVLQVFNHMTKKEKVDPSSINIMSQYNSQCTEIRYALTEQGEEKFNVTTVVSSQGGEWDYVIFSLVRSLPGYLIEKNPTEGWCIQNLGFITDRHQINVALTRARKGLVIIGNKHLLKCDEVWKKLLEDYEAKKCLFDGIRFPRHTNTSQLEE